MKHTKYLPSLCPTCGHEANVRPKDDGLLLRNIEIAKNRIAGFSAKEVGEAYRFGPESINRICKELSDRKPQGYRRWRDTAPEFGYGWSSIPQARKNPDHWLSWINAVYK